MTNAKHIYMKIALIAAMVSFLNLSCGNNTAASLPPTKEATFNLITEKQFNAFFPQRNAFYTYAAFMKAIKELSNIQVKVNRRSVSVYQYIRTDKSSGKSTVVRQDPDYNAEWNRKKPDSVFTVDYGKFCTEKDDQTNKKELAAFLANIAHETRNGEIGKYDDGLMFIHEIDTSNSYLADNDTYPAAPGKKYYGRGPIQLSYNGNYGKASDFIFGDKNVLLKNPQLIEKDAVVAFKTAIWFWMTPETHKPSAHDVMTGKWQPNTADKAAGRTPGFGMTINIINGQVECNKGPNRFMDDRIAFYQYFLKKFGIADPNCDCSCAKMMPYPNY
jgi:predicted chitinase